MRLDEVGDMQPYLFPYIGYFQLIQAVDEFVVYDNIQFIKKGWINRNRILVNGKDEYITFPLRKDSDTLDVYERYLAEIWPVERKKMLNRIVESYRKAPFFNEAYPVIERIIMFEEKNLFGFVLNSLKSLTHFLGIKTPLIVSSSIPVDHNLKGVDKVIAIAKERGAKTYINAIGGKDLYDNSLFDKNDLELKFINMSRVEYKQLDNQFVPFLSIIDVMMFNSKMDTENFLKEYTLT